jgi:hypothetical protein
LLSSTSMMALTSTVVGARLNAWTRIEQAATVVGRETDSKLYCGRVDIAGVPVGGGETFAHQTHRGRESNFAADENRTGWERGRALATQATAVAPGV